MSMSSINSRMTVMSWVKCLIYETLNLVGASLKNQCVNQKFED
jgi:hypothetical protein